MKTINSAARRHLLACVEAMKQLRQQARLVSESGARLTINGLEHVQPRTITYDAGGVQVSAESRSSGKRAHVSFTFRAVPPPTPPDEEHVPLAHTFRPGQVLELRSDSGERRRARVIHVGEERVHLHVIFWGGMFCIDVRLVALFSRSRPVEAC